MKKSVLNNIIIVSLIQSIIYLLLFIVIPAFLVRHVDDWIWIGTGLFMTIAISSITLFIFIPKMRYWVWGIFILWGCIMIYHPDDLYGISSGNAFGLDFFPAHIDAMAFAIGVFLLQCGIKVVGSVIYRVYKAKS